MKIPEQWEIYLFRVNNTYKGTTCEICSKLTIKIPVTSFWCLYCYLSAYLTPFSNDSVADFKQTNIWWKRIFIMLIPNACFSKFDILLLKQSRKSYIWNCWQLYTTIEDSAILRQPPRSNCASSETKNVSAPVEKMFFTQNDTAIHIHLIMSNIYPLKLCYLDLRAFIGLLSFFQNRYLCHSSSKV